jgi:hypothetical protein
MRDQQTIHHDLLGGASVIRLIAAMMLALTACGSGSGEEPPPILGQWDGEATWTLVDGVSLTVPSRLVIAEDDACGDEAPPLVLSNLCPIGGGRTTLPSYGPTIRWDGAVVCAPVASQECPSVTVVMQSVTLTQHDNRLTMTGSGTSHGCGANGKMSVSATLVKTSTPAAQ